MERVLSQEERIKRAEQIAELRRSIRERYPNNNIYDNRKNYFDNNEKQKNNFIVSKMMRQICICLIIYTIFFIIKNQNFIFSEEFIKKTKDILSYDVNFVEVYNNGVNFLEQQYNNENSKVENTKNEDNKTNEIKNEKESEENQKKEEKKDSTKESSNKEVSIMEKDVEFVKQNYSLKKPVKGIVSSEFGDREDPNPVVTEEHKGIDLAADEGTNIVAAMDGVVDIATTSSSYGKYIEITDGKLKTIYAHCNKLCVKKGEKVKAGQKIAEVGSTGAVTGSHLHFEIKVSDRHINPALVLEF